MSVDVTRSPFYSWLDNGAIRELRQGAGALAPGERLVLIKGLIPGLIEDLGETTVETFLDELRVKTRRYAEAAAQSGKGGASRQTPGEPLGGPMPDGVAHLPGSRDPRRPGGRALEREWETELWEKMRAR